MFGKSKSKRKTKRKTKRKSKRKTKRGVRGYEAEGKALGLEFVRKVKRYAEYRVNGLSVTKAKKKAGL